MTGDNRMGKHAKTYRALYAIGIVSFVMGIFIPKDSLWILLSILGMGFGFGGAGILWNFEWADGEMRRRKN